MLSTLLVVLCVLFRLIPHPANFAPVGAVAVFAGRTQRLGAAIGLVILAMFVGDLALAGLQGHAAFDRVTPFVYGGYCIQALLGHGLRRYKGGTILAALTGSAAFFGLSNLGVWLFGGLYPRSGAGLAACFAAAVPFLGGTITGDLVWILILTLVYRPLATRLAGRSFWVHRASHDLAVI